MRWNLSIGALLLVVLLASCGAPAAPTTLRLGVSLDAATLADFEPAIKALDERHSEWQISLEQTPQQDRLTKLNAQIASGTLPDLVLNDGVSVQQFIRQGAFADLSDLVSRDKVQLDAYFHDTVLQFAYGGKQWGLPTVAAPEVVFYNKGMFDAAGLAYPTDEWSFEQMRDAARKLTLDSAGRSAEDAGFDAQKIVQWGWNNSPGFIWTNHFVQPFGADYCADPECTRLQMDTPAVVEAFNWWAELVHKDHAALHDPYSGAQTGVPGDPFIAGKAAMGFNGYFAVAQLAEQSAIDYDIVQPFTGRDGKRYSVLSIQGYAVSETSSNREQAWKLLLALNDPQFLAEVWGKPGHFIPALREAAPSFVDADRPPANQQAFLQALEYGQIFRPYTASAFEVFDKTAPMFKAALTGQEPVADTMRRIDETANPLLARDK